MQTKASVSEILTNTKIYSANFFSDLHPKCSVMVTHVTFFFNILFSGQNTLDIENKDNNLRVY